VGVGGVLHSERVRHQGVRRRDEWTSGDRQGLTGASRVLHY
jgi:hypothetical protein